MAHQALYRRYRSRRFGEVLGQDHVVLALRNAVRDGRVSHAYLFSGPRGTGKTSTARILAKALNCENLVDGEPCLVCASCLAIEAGTSYDLHELDAASNNGVDNMRDLIAKAALGSPGRTKVYILDEVHMLSTPASNALLKTLEEPPGHVVFVLATTDPHKVLETIRSRTQHLEFHLLPADVLEAHVRYIVEDAGLDVGADGIAYALKAGGGSARDTLSALEQIASAGGVVDRVDAIDDLVEALVERDTGRALVAVNDAVAAGRDPRVLGEGLLGQLRDVFLAAMKASLDHLPDAERTRVTEVAQRVRSPFVTRALEVIGEALVEMRQAPDPRISLEVALVRLTHPDADSSPAALLERIDRLERQVAAAPPPAPAPARPPAQLAVPGRPPAAAPPPADPPAPAAVAPAGDMPSRDQLTLAWGDTILGRLPGPARIRFTGGRFAAVEDGHAVFALPNSIHASRCEEYRAHVEAALAEHFGVPVPLRLVVDTGVVAPPPVPADDVVDVDDLRDAPPDNRSGLDRLAEAFPGAEIMDEGT
jgi:DNA polymerase-3 subunit gamma/tau